MAESRGDSYISGLWGSFVEEVLLHADKSRIVYLGNVGQAPGNYAFLDVPLAIQTLYTI